MNELDKLSIGKRILQQRELLGYTREELAERQILRPASAMIWSWGKKECP